MERTVVGIPARMGSTRFPGKPLCNLLGASMLEHCVRRAEIATGVDTVFVAAADREICDAVEDFGGLAILTESSIARPSLRVAHAAMALDLEDDDIVVVAQGDEPLMRPEMYEAAIEALRRDPSVSVVNLCTPITEEEWRDPNEIKVVTDNNMNALFMSRAMIPSINHEERRCTWFKQVCLMPFRWGFLRDFCFKLSATPLEEQESIEMLRALQHGFKVRMVVTQAKTKSVDSESDRQVVEELMRADDLLLKYLPDWATRWASRSS